MSGDIFPLAQYVFMVWRLVKHRDFTFTLPTEIWREGVEWIYLVQDRKHWLAVLNTIINLRVP